MAYTFKMFHIVLVVCCIGVSSINGCLQTADKEIKLKIGETVVLDAQLPNSYKYPSNFTIDFVAEHKNIITVSLDSANAGNLEIRITALTAGKSEVYLICDSNSMNPTEELFILVQVHRSKILDIVSVTFGWLYFLAWSVCFYPQLYENYKSKSVVGLNFDTVLFGWFGYIMYNTFNTAMVNVPLIKRQYSRRYPHGITPVLTNDLVFSMHGVLVTSVTAYQCMTYYKEKQKVSSTATAIVVLCSLAVIACAVLAFCDVVLWLDVVYLCSYIKMYGNVMLYIPQVYMNYKRRSTSGFSIAGVIIDLLGSIFSMMQVFLDGFNYDDIKTVFENPTKFGIGIITLGVSVVFIVQHYILYRTPSKKQNLESKTCPC